MSDPTENSDRSRYAGILAAHGMTARWNGPSISSPSQKTEPHKGRLPLMPSTNVRSLAIGASWEEIRWKNRSRAPYCAERRAYRDEKEGGDG